MNMANSSSQKYASIARPYALAAFEYARDQKQLPAWKAFLANSAEIVTQPEISKLLNNPEISAEKWFELINAVQSDQLTTEQKNFLHLVTQNKRLIVQPEIAVLFNDYYAELEKISTVRVVTAIEISEEYRQKLIQAFSKRIHHDVTLQCEVDPSIIGGAIFYVGDNVIDGSVLGKLNRLRESTLG